MCCRSNYYRSSACCLLATMHVHICKTKCTAVTRTKAGGGSGLLYSMHLG